MSTITPHSATPHNAAPHNAAPHNTKRSLASGLSHAALVTGDLDRLTAFYAHAFAAEVMAVPAPPTASRSAMVRLSDAAALALVEVPGSTAVQGAGPELARGHLDHIAIDVDSAAALDEIRLRLVELGATDGVVKDYGPMLAVNFTDPDGMSSEVCWVREPSFAGAHAPEPLEGSLADLAG